VQTAEGALNEVASMLNRMRDLTVQAANSGGSDTDAKAAAQQEILQLRSEVDRISSSTKWGQTSLLAGTYGTTAAQTTGFVTNAASTTTAAATFTININGLGATTVNVAALTAQPAATVGNALATAINAALASSGTAAVQAFAGKVSVTTTPEGVGAAFTINVSGLTSGQTFAMASTGVNLTQFGFTAAPTVVAASGTGGVFQVGAYAGDTVTISVGGVSSTLLTLTTLDVTTDTGAASALTSLDAAIKSVSSTRATLGSLQNRFESMINNLSVTAENLTASESRIRDLDMASEMVGFTKNQVLQQAGTAMLAQANQIPQSILSLLRG
jgi:flagellin